MPDKMEKGVYVNKTMADLTEITFRKMKRHYVKTNVVISMSDLNYMNCYYVCHCLK